jgi:hypothetical protein
MQTVSRTYTVPLNRTKNQELAQDATLRVCTTYDARREIWFLGRLGLVRVRVAVEVAVGVVVRVVVRVRGRADRGQDDGWVGHTPSRANTVKRCKARENKESTTEQATNIVGAALGCGRE